MLTRAMSLEIVIGNPETLKQDPCWSKFIKYCEKNQALLGDTPMRAPKRGRDWEDYETTKRSRY